MFDLAQVMFRSAPTKKSAGNYMSVALEYWDDGMIEDETLKNAVSETAYWLQRGELMVAP